MAFIFTCGTHKFRSLIQGQENTTVQCHNCGNWSGRLVKDWEWFTFCFVPIIPFSLKPWEEVSCPVCSRTQPIRDRPDVQQIMQSGGKAPPQQVPLQGGHQGWNSQAPQQQYPPQAYGQAPPPAEGMGGQKQGVYH